MMPNNLKTRYMMRNDCYTVGRKITPKGIMLHSTATPGVMAPDWFNRWNKSFKAGEINRQVCVHAFLDDKEIWQYLPWDHRGWHAGGKANDTHIGLELCEPGGFSYSGGFKMIGYDVKKNEVYFNKIWQNTLDLCVFLCKKYGLTEKDILCHSEGSKKGIASSHADVMHWFPMHSKNMILFREAVRNKLNAPLPTPSSTKTLYRVRKTWNDAKTQKGAFRKLMFAIQCADNHPGYAVFDETGTKIYTRSPDMSFEIYIVKKGDSLWAIAKKKLGNSSHLREIKELNGLTSDVIYPGQKLKLPK